MIYLYSWWKIVPSRQASVCKTPTFPKSMFVWGITSFFVAAEQSVTWLQWSNRGTETGNIWWCYTIKCFVYSLKTLWLTSYLSDQQNHVKLDNVKSDNVASSVGVTQGSVLGPNLFTMYINPIMNTALAFKVSTHQYDDNTQRRCRPKWKGF